jgi:ferredoxin
LTRERLYVPAPNGRTELPSALSDDLYLNPGKDGSSPGILIEPSGLELLNSIEKETGIPLSGAGMEGAEGALQMLKLGLGMMRDFHFKQRDDRIILRVEYSSLLDACRSVRKEKPDTCRQVACHGCSCLLTALARATGKAVAIERVDNSSDRVEFTLSLREW